MLVCFRLCPWTAIKKVLPQCGGSFSGTHVDMITERYNTDYIVWQARLLCVCRLMSGEQTDVVSNVLFDEIISLEKPEDLCIHLVYVYIYIYLFWFQETSQNVLLKPNNFFIVK